MITIADILLEGGLLLLLMFTPLAFGMIHVWSITIFRVAGVLLLALWLIRQALARVPFQWRMNGLMALVLAYLGINLASLAVSVNLDDSQEEVANLLAYLAVFFLTAQVCRTPRHALRLCGVQVFVVVLLSIYSILQHYRIEFIPWNPPAAERSFATLANPNRLAGYLIMVAPLLMVSALSAPSRWVRMGAMLSTMLVYTGLIFTYSRGGWLGLLVALGCLGVIVVVTGRQRISWIRRSLMPVMAIVAILTVITVAQRGTRLLDPRNYSREVHLDIRWSMWTGAVRIIEAHPWLGTGIGTYRTAIYQAESEDLQRRLVFERQTPTYSHNDYLQTASEIGLPGLCILVVLLFFSLPVCGRSSGDIRSHTCARWSWGWLRGSWRSWSTVLLISTCT